jgi:hypothetical protein
VLAELAVGMAAQLHKALEKVESKREHKRGAEQRMLLNTYLDSHPEGVERMLTILDSGALEPSKKVETFPRTAIRNSDVALLHIKTLMESIHPCCVPLAKACEANKQVVRQLLAFVCSVESEDKLVSKVRSEWADILRARAIKLGNRLSTLVYQPDGTIDWGVSGLFQLAVADNQVVCPTSKTFIVLPEYISIGKGAWTIVNNFSLKTAQLVSSDTGMRLVLFTSFCQQGKVFEGSDVVEPLPARTDHVPGAGAASAAAGSADAPLAGPSACAAAEEGILETPRKKHRLPPAVPSKAFVSAASTAPKKA